MPDTGGDDAPGQVAYLSPASGYVSIYRKSLERGGKAHADRHRRAVGRARVVPSVRLPHGRLAARVSAVHRALRRPRRAHRLGPRSAGKCAGRYQFPELVSLLSPHWMPDGRSIVLSGLSESGVSDLYRVRLPDGELEPLTADRYQDLDPSPSADGRRLVFASDRTADGRERRGQSVPARSRHRRPSRSSPAATGWTSRPSGRPDGRIYFTSDRDGVLNVFSVDTLGDGRRETSAWTGAFDAVPLPDSGGLLVGGFHDLSWNLYRIPVDSAARADRFAARCRPAPAGQWAWDDARATPRPASPPGASPTAGGSPSTSRPATRWSSRATAAPRASSSS